MWPPGAANALTAGWSTIVTRMRYVSGARTTSRATMASTVAWRAGSRHRRSLGASWATAARPIRSSHETGRIDATTLDAAGMPQTWRAPPTATTASAARAVTRSEEHTSELQSLAYLVCRLLLEKKKKKK